MDNSLVFSVNLLKAIGLFPSPYLLRIQIFQVIFTIFYLVVDFVIIRIANDIPFKFDNYFITALLQSEFCCVIQIYFFWRVHKSRKFYKKFDNFYIDRKIEKNVKFVIFIVILTRVLKFLFTISKFPFEYLYFIKTILPEFILVMNDLFFITLIQSLTSKVKFRKTLFYRKKSFNKQTFDLFEIEKFIMKRFSKDLFISISYNYFQVLHCLYWIFIRMNFGVLTDGEHTNEG